MTYPNTPSETRRSASGWRLDGNPPIDATIWHVTAPGKPHRYDAEVWKNGQLMETLTGPTRDAVVEQLKRRYLGAESADEGA